MQHTDRSSVQNRFCTTPPQDTPYKQRQLHRDCNSRKEGRAKVVGGPGEMEVGKRTYHTFQTSIGVQFRIRNNANWQRL